VLKQVNIFPNGDQIIHRCGKFILPLDRRTLSEDKFWEEFWIRWWSTRERRFSTWLFLPSHWRNSII